MRHARAARARLGDGRLAAVAALVPAGSRVADIGTDHARLAVALVADGHATFCVASDVRPAAVRAARALAPRAAADRLAARRATGLAALEPADRIDVVVIAGLGARSIVAILDERRLAALGVRRLVLQPQSEPARVRRWLADHGFAIVDERVVLERGRYYFVLAAERARAGCPADPAELDVESLAEAGPCLVRSGDPLVAAYWRRELARAERLAAHGGAARRRAALARRVLGALAAARRP